MCTLAEATPLLFLPAASEDPRGPLRFVTPAIASRGVVLGILFATLGRAGIARAQDAGGDREPIHVQVDSSASCLSEARFFERLEARTSRVRRANAGESARTFVVSVNPEAGGFFGRLVVIEPSGPTEPRVVRASSCDEATSALAFIAAVSIDSHANAATVAGPVAPQAPAVPAASAASAAAARTLGVEVGAKLGISAAYNGGPNPLGLGLGGRAGAVLFDHLYGGVDAIYYFGTSGVHTSMYGVGAGWGFKPLDNVTIRPQVGLGNANFDSVGNNVYVEPGVTVLAGLGTLFVGADVSILVFPGFNFDEGDSAFFITVHGQVGVKF